MFIDSHCHLNHNRLKNLGEIPDIIGEAHKNKVMGMLTICCRMHEETDTLISIAEQNDNVWCTVGTHPHDASDKAEMAYTTEDIVKLATSNDNIVGIGESGLDYFYKNAEVEDQKESFRKHIRACIEADLPLVVHARDADEDIIQIIKEENPERNLRGVMHCFSSGRKWVRKL